MYIADTSHLLASLSDELEGQRPLADVWDRLIFQTELEELDAVPLEWE